VFHLGSYLLGIVSVVVAECIAAYVLHRLGRRLS